MVRTLSFPCGGRGSVPGQGTKIRQAGKPKKREKINQNIGTTERTILPGHTAQSRPVPGDWGHLGGGGWGLGLDRE